jgi:hypothetical protein
MRGIQAPGVPLFSCPICGWTTTASLAQAVRAHQLGVPGCDGILDQVAYAGKRIGAPLTVGERDGVKAQIRAVPKDTPGD